MFLTLGKEPKVSPLFIVPSEPTENASKGKVTHVMFSIGKNFSF